MRVDSQCGRHVQAESIALHFPCSIGIGQLRCDGTRAKTKFRLSAKRMSPFKSAGVSVQSTTGSRDVRISGSNAGYTMFRGSVKGTDYPLHSPVSASPPLPCVTLCHHISTGAYRRVFPRGGGGGFVEGKRGWGDQPPPRRRGFGN